MLIKSKSLWLQFAFIASSLHFGLSELLTRFYDGRNFEGLFYSANASVNCTVLPEYARDRAVSIESDACIMVYEGVNCNGYNFKITPTDNEKGKDLSHIDPFINSQRKAHSFKLCSSISGDGIQIDLYNSSNYQALHRQFNNVCGCQNLPGGSVGSLDNHGNCIRVYFTKDCKGSSRDIPGGRNAITDNLLLYEHFATVENWKVVQLSEMVSFQPCVIPSNCSSLTAVAYQFEISPTSTYNNFDKVELSAKSIFTNNGSAKITQEFRSTKTIKTSSTINRSASLTDFSSVSTEDGAEVEVKATAEFEAGALFAKAKSTFSAGLKASLKSSSAESETLSHGEGNATTHEESKQYTIAEKIEIPPCTRYEVSSFAKVLKDFPVEYAVYLRVTGTLANKPLTPDEIKVKLRQSNMTYVRDYDSNTVIAKFSGTMTASLGLEAIIDGHGAPIEGCLQVVPRTGRVKDAEMEVDVMEHGKAYVLPGMMAVLIIIMGILVLTIICRRKDKNTGNGPAYHKADTSYIDNEMYA